MQFYWSDINVFIKKVVLNDSCKVLKGLKEFLDFLKFPMWSPLCMCKWRLWSPLWFWVKISKSFKMHFSGYNINIFIKKLVLNDSCKVLKGLKEFLDFLKFPMWSPLCMCKWRLWSPLWFWVKISKSFKMHFSGYNINIFIKKLVLNDSCKVLKGLKQFLNFLKFPCGPLFACASNACGPPFGFGSKFLNHSKSIFLALI